MEDIKQMLEIPTKEEIISKWQQEVREQLREHCRFCGVYKEPVTENCACPAEDRYDEDGIASYE